MSVGKLSPLSQYDHIQEFSCYYPCLTRELLTELHKKGKKVNAWTVNNKKHIKRLINLGVDGIITDFPDRVKKLR
ncbi:MAG: hypothetical protein HC880_12235 [Bacteroidia bacterium]|nr:hypothetical protein [Bacteroidia bacterium]